jgi:hypothetical protein
MEHDLEKQLGEHLQSCATTALNDVLNEPPFYEETFTTRFVKLLNQDPKPEGFTAVRTRPRRRAPASG